MREVPQIEHVLAIDDALAAHHLEDLLAEHDRRDGGFIFFEQGAVLERLEGVRGHQLVENRAIEDGGAADRIRLLKNQVVFEQREKQVLQERIEMRDQLAARFGQFGERGCAGANLVPGAAIVAVAFEPRDRVGDRGDVKLARLYGFGFARHRTISLPDK